MSAGSGQRESVSRSTVTVYSKPGCHLCSEAIALLEPLSDELGFELLELDITREDALHRAYFERIPVILLAGEELSEYFVDVEELRGRLRASSRVTDR
jgi:glutaredoxin